MSRLREPLQQAWDRLQNEAGLRAGAWLIAMLALLQIVFVLSDRVGEGAPRIQELHDQYVRLEQVLQAADWQARAEAARARLVATEGRFWSAESEGLARAEFQVWLERMAGRANFELMELELRSVIPIRALPGWYRLGASLQGLSDPTAVVRLLGAMADAERLVMVDGVRIGGQNARSQLDVHAVIRIEGEP